jgi:hypothetical protein
MAHAPGYKKLMKLDEMRRSCRPRARSGTDHAEDRARRYDISVVGVDIGGATTDVF